MKLCHFHICSFYLLIRKLSICATHKIASAASHGRVNSHVEYCTTKSGGICRMSNNEMKHTCSKDTTAVLWDTFGIIRNTYCSTQYMVCICFDVSEGARLMKWFRRGASSEWNKICRCNCNGKERNELISIIRRGQDQSWRVVRHVADARQRSSEGAFRLITVAHVRMGNQIGWPWLNAVLWQQEKKFPTYVSCYSVPKTSHSLSALPVYSFCKTCGIDPSWIKLPEETPS